MPKKSGVNSKATEAKERKDNFENARQEKAAKKEDRLWQDDDKKFAKKQQKREEEERKRAEASRRKAETKFLLEKEMSSMRRKGKQPLANVNRNQVVEEMEKRQRASEAMKSKKDHEMAENTNRAMSENLIATSVEEALAVLRVTQDRNPDQRTSAAYKEFESDNMARIKAENPSLRMSQWKQLLAKEWNRLQKNPFL